MLIDQPKVKTAIPFGLQLPEPTSDGSPFFVVGQGLFICFGGEWHTVSHTETPEAVVDDITPLKAAQAKLKSAFDELQSAQQRFEALQQNLERAIEDHLRGSEQRFTTALTSIDSSINAVAARVGSAEEAVSALPEMTRQLEQLNGHIGKPTDLSELTQRVALTELDALRGIKGSIQTQLNALAADKLSKTGKIGLDADLSLGGHRLTNVAFPEKTTDAATKGYVEMFVQGVRWVESVDVATSNDITLSGLQMVGGRLLKVNDRVLVRCQTNAAQNGIYLAATGDWSRAPDYSMASQVGSTAVLVSADKSAWLQTATVVGVGIDAMKFTSFSVPHLLEGGNGIDISAGRVQLKLGGGTTLDGQGALMLDVLPGGGLMLTKNNVGATLEQTGALALAPTGIRPGTYNNLGSKQTPFTLDAKGRVVAIGEPTDISPDFTNISGKPTTLRGYGINDAVSTTGASTINGVLSFTNGTSILGTTPTPNQALFSTAKVSTVGDGRTHFGFFAGGEFINYIRGARTQLDGDVVITGKLQSSELDELRAEVAALKALVESLVGR